MVTCRNCAAPLPAYSGTCAYCGGSNDVDREALARAASAHRDEARPCPVCGTAMAAMKAGGSDAPLVVDYCGSCHGHFFPFFGLEPVLADKAKYGELLDARRLDDLSRHSNGEEAIAYRKCPICSKFMNRINYGKRSGVITDQCHNHGIWLDAGELRRLVEWKNAGGEQADAAWRREWDRQQERQRKAAEDRLERWRRSAGPDGG